MTELSNMPPGCWISLDTAKSNYFKSSKKLAVSTVTTEQVQ